MIHTFIILVGMAILSGSCGRPIPRDELGNPIFNSRLATLAKYLPVFETRDYGTVFDLAVTKRCRRTGIGERLYHAAETWFADHGVHRIEIRVAMSNESSTSFWQKMGLKSAQPYD